MLFEGLEHPVNFWELKHFGISRLLRFRAAAVRCEKTAP